MVSGPVTLLIDFSGSMLEKVPGTNRRRLDEVHDALGAVLDELPVNTTLTLAVFWGKVNAQRVEPVKGAIKLVWRGIQDQKDEVMKAVKARVPELATNTPLARSVEQVLSRPGADAFWPALVSGVPTLVVLTDGADNWDKENAGARVRKALLDAPWGDTAFHLIFFGLDPNDAAVAEEQYRVLEDDREFLAEGLTPPRLWQGVNDARALALGLRQAMLPQIPYQGDPAPVAERPRGRLHLTLLGEGLFRPSRGLAAGSYDLGGLRSPQRLRLDPGDRLVLQARPRGDRFELFIPPTAFTTAESKGLPRATGQERFGNGVHLTVPGYGLDPKMGSSDLKLTTTLEPLNGVPAGPVLATPRPAVAWFDVEYADGKPAEPGLRPCMRVVNRPGLVAPAWDLAVTQWDLNRAGATGTAVRRPAVTGYWFGTLPAPAGRIPVDLRRPGEAATPTPRLTVRGEAVEVLGVSVEEVKPVVGGDPAQLPEGMYLTVRLRYAGPGRYVFLRPGALKGPNQRVELHERHLYFDPERRYTARFGPLDQADLNAVVDLDVFAVADLKGSADGTYSATVRLTDRPIASHPLPDELTAVRPGDQ
jgi:hypothetical protein